MLLKSRRYRNKRLGEFLKELDLTEGRSTGIPTIQRELAANGSPKAWIETDPDRLSCLMYIPVHPAFLEDVGKIGGKKATLRQEKIIALLRENPSISTASIAIALNIGYNTVTRELAKMSDFVRHVGPKNGGYWEIFG